jgi:Tfp pilus assembly major pilin PilA
VTSDRRLHRLAAFAAASVLFAITSTVSALASSGETKNHDAPPAPPAAVAVAVGAGDYQPSASGVAKTIRPAVVPAVAAAPAKAVVAKPVAAKPAAKPKPVAKASTKATTRKTTTTRVAAARVVTARTITISSYVDAPGSQKAIDACKLVLWTHAPLWLAGHNYCGFQWLASVPTGTTVRVTKGAAAGTFVVTGHVRLNRQGGALPALKADLVLQTCVGSGTGLTLLRRV